MMIFTNVVLMWEAGPTLNQHWAHVARPCRPSLPDESLTINLLDPRTRILVQVMIYRRLRIGRDNHLDLLEAMIYRNLYENTGPGPYIYPKKQL